MVNGKKTGAVILAAGKGTRMRSGGLSPGMHMENVIPKQYMPLAGKPMIAWSLEAFEKSATDEMVLVIGAGEEEYVKKEILLGLSLKKPLTITTGGAERYLSVYEGIRILGDCDIVLIHDGARPLITEDIITRVTQGAIEYGACVAAVPVKDTIRTADENGFATETYDRAHMWQMQTPQGFAYSLLSGAYEKLMKDTALRQGITDDACVVERTMGTKIKLVEGSYENIKVTTPEDPIIAEALLKKRMAGQ